MATLESGFIALFAMHFRMSLQVLLPGHCLPARLTYESGESLRTDLTLKGLKNRGDLGVFREESSHGSAEEDLWELSLRVVLWMGGP